MSTLSKQVPVETEPIHIGSRLELFVDDYLIESKQGALALNMHHPDRHDIVFKCDQPWEGNGSLFQSVVKDNDRFLLYYRGGHIPFSDEYQKDKLTWETLCVAESRDGIHWSRPDLGIVDFRGSRSNNMVLDETMVKEVSGSPAHTAVFKDPNPDCPDDERFKIVMHGRKPFGLYLLVSGDGYHFKLKSTQPFMIHGAFDSQNLAFYDTVRGEYRVYHRGFNGKVRDILTCTAKDFESFPEPDWLTYPGSPTMALYTNQIAPYYRAPHIFMGFPMRYCERGWDGPVFDLPGLDNRLKRAGYHPRYGMAITDAVFMTSRDGQTFNRRPEAFLRPGPRQRESWVYGDNFICWGMIETPSLVEDAPNEITLYAIESYWENRGVQFRRYTMRLDGFVSAYAPYAGGELVTKPMTFEGGSLAVNASTSAFGSFQVEIQHPDGTPVEGFELESCPEIFCDSVDYTVHWHDDCDVSKLADMPVRLRFVLKDADIYSFQFVPRRDPRKHYEIPDADKLPPKNTERGRFCAVDDDFQQMEAGEAPPAGDGDAGWSIYQAEADTVQVREEDGNHYLNVSFREGNTESPSCARMTLKKQDVVDAAGGLATINLRLRIPSSNQGPLKLDLYDEPVGKYGNLLSRLLLTPDGHICYCEHGEAAGADKRYTAFQRTTVSEPIQLEALSFNTDEWFELEIRVDLDRRCYALQLAGESVSDLPFVKTELQRIRTLIIYPGAENTAVDIDHIHIEVIPADDTSENQRTKEIR